MDIYNRIDLHIHSYNSGKTKSGDYEITKNSTIENIPTLIKKLNDNEINMIAITDHNIFDKRLYKELKKCENKSSLKKVLPGVELDLIINDISVHTICVFNDERDNHAELIEENFVTKEKYSLSELGNLLANIGLDVILIAHQKTDYLAKNQNHSNLSSSGIESFYKMIDVEFFDSLEVQSSKVEGILRNRFFKDEINDQTLISGSDCHDWAVYPLHDKSKTVKPMLIKMKAEATFRGLVMSITNTKRFVVDNDINRKPFINQIKIRIKGKEKNIPLSYGINAIIGDNSVGKSTLVKSLLGIAPKEALDFFDRHNISVEQMPMFDSDYQYNSQGDIREKFLNTDTKLPIQEEFKEQFKPINIDNILEVISGVLDLFTKLWDDNEKRHSNKSKLINHLSVSSYDNTKSYFLLFSSIPCLIENKYDGITKRFSNNLDSLVKLGKDYSKVLEEEDLNRMRNIYRELQAIKTKYSNLEINAVLNNKIINSFISSADCYQKETEQQKSTEEANYNQYLNNISKITTYIKNQLIFDNTDSIDPFKDFKEIHIIPVDNTLGSYHFISKPKYNKTITRETIIDFIYKRINVENIFKATKSEIISNIKGKRFNNKVCSNLNELKSALLQEFKEEFLKITVELKHGNDNLNEGNSAGINALYYLDILSYLYDKKVFIIDQPEDDVSQSKINSVLVNSLRNFAKKTQVIIITHNPQLVVNLDVDNVIVLKKNEETDEISFKYGPLERKDSDVDMIKLVANTLEGGIDVIKKRWKRYDKAN